MAHVMNTNVVQMKKVKVMTSLMIVTALMNKLKMPNHLDAPKL